MSVSDTSSSSGGIGGSGYSYAQLGGAAGTLFRDIGGYVSSSTAASAAGLDASAEREAAQLAFANATTAQAETDIKMAEAQRATSKVIGSQEADISGAGFAASGTALDLLRSSTQEAALEVNQTYLQGNQQYVGFYEQGNADLVQAQAAQAAESADQFGAISSIVGALVDVAGVVAAPYTGGASLLAASAVNAGIQGAK